MENETNYTRLSSVQKYFESEKEDDTNHELDKDILRPFMHICLIPGKLITKRYLQAVNSLMKIPEDKLEIISDILFNIHNNFLITDDIQDSSDLRRGVPAAHKIFGFEKTVIAIDYVYTLTLEKVMELNHPQAVSIYITHLMDALEGQGMELYWRDNFIYPTEEEYNRMLIKKSVNILLIPLKLVELFSKENKDIKPFSETLGWYCQIVNDYKNLNSEAYLRSKGFCEDTTEGKFSFPIFHAIKACPEEGKIIMDILRQRTRDVELKKYCLSLIEKCGGFEYTKKVLKQLENDLYEEMRRIDENNVIKKFFQCIYKPDN